MAGFYDDAGAFDVGRCDAMSQDELRLEIERMPLMGDGNEFGNLIAHLWKRLQRLEEPSQNAT